MKKITFRNHLFTLKRSEWTGNYQSECGCPMPPNVYSELSSVATDFHSMKALHPFKRIGKADEVLVAIRPDNYFESQSRLEVIVEGEYEVVEKITGNPSRFSVVILK